MNKYRILIIDDNKELAECLGLIINNTGNYEVVGIYDNYDPDAVDLKKVYPDLILMDINLAGYSGIEATRLIKREFPPIKIIVISVYDDEEHILQALKSGADGYLSKICSYTEILLGIETTLGGGAAISSNIAKRLFQSFQLNVRSPLSDRESEVLQKFASGFNYTKIAQEMFLSKETIKSHMRNIYIKLGVKSKNEAIEFARGKKYIF